MQYKAGWINGVSINALLLAIGLVMSYYKDLFHQQQWLNNYYYDKNFVTAMLEEPLTEKANSFNVSSPFIF